MNRQAMVYIFSFGFSTLAAIIYSFVANEINLPIIVLLLSSVIFLSYTATTVLDVEDTIIQFRQLSEDVSKQRSFIVDGLVDRLHRPSARVISNQVDLVRSVGNAIRGVSKDRNGSVVFVGAVSLQTPVEGEDLRTISIDYEDDEEQSPFQIYRGLLEEAASKNIEIIRFVSLPKASELQNRSKKWVTDYVRWLDSQLGQIHRNPNFFLVNSPRSPKWGTSGARVLAGEYIFDMTHKGGSTIEIRDERMSSLQSEKVIDTALSGSKKNIQIFCSDVGTGKVKFPNCNVCDEPEYKEFVLEAHGILKSMNN